MRPDPDTPLFLERRGYRRRRIIDMLRILPFLGGLIFVAPALLLPAGETARLSLTLLYFFGVWVLLIFVCFTLSRGNGHGG
ncbi:MAG: hypothetical protein AAF982_07400 [Pseudomonadota bacterium]